MWNADECMREVESALACFHFRRARALVQQFVRQVRRTDGPLPEQTTRALLRVLRRKRKFDLLLIAADALLERAPEDLTVRLAYAQALLDQGHLAAACTVLEVLAKDAADAVAGATSAAGCDAAEHASLEARGLLGRLYKQRYVDADAPHVEANARAMQRSIDYYWDAYQEHPGDPARRWHGINAVALAARAERDGLAPALAFSADGLAQELLTALTEARTASDVWAYATGLEAGVALGDDAAIRRWAERYLQAPDTDAFEVGSLLRQLTEVWQLDPREPPGLELLPVLQAKLLSLDGGRVELDAATLAPQALRDAGLERTFGAGFVDIHGYLRGLERARSVARLAHAASPTRGDGTGFLVRGGDLHEAWGDELLLVTNCHVLARPGTQELHALEPADALATFSYGGAVGAEPVDFRVTEILWQSPVSGLDATVCRLSGTPPGVTPCPLRTRRLQDPVSDQRVFIAGHPDGRDHVHFSLYNNRVHAQNERYLHYRAATSGGSSGSPVFDSRWELVAVHHKGSWDLPALDGSGPYPANQGIQITAIVTAIRAKLSC